MLDYILIALGFVLPLVFLLVSDALNSRNIRKLNERVFDLETVVLKHDRIMAKVAGKSRKK